LWKQTEGGWDYLPVKASALMMLYVLEKSVTLLPTLRLSRRMSDLHAHTALILHPRFSAGHHPTSKAYYRLQGLLRKQEIQLVQLLNSPTLTSTAVAPEQQNFKSRYP
jgi:hypothetical protein